MKYTVPVFALLALVIILATCYPWDLERREDPLPENGHVPDTCCNGDCDVDTCEDLRFITFDTLFGSGANDEAMSVICTQDGGYSIIGRTVDMTDDDFETYLLHIDSMGNKKWDVAFNNTDDDYGVGLLQIENGNYIILGNIDSDANTWQNLLMETDVSGNLEGQDDYGLDKIDLAYSFTRKINDAGYLLLGYTETYRTNDLGLQAMIFNVDNTLNETGRKHFGAANDDYAYCIERTADDNYIMLMSAGKQDETMDLHLVKLDQNLVEVWNRTVIVNCLPVVGSVSEIPGGGFVLGGAVSGNRLRLVKTDSEGLNPVEETFSDILADSTVSVIPTADGGFAALTNNMVLVRTNASLKQQGQKKEFEGEIYGNRALIQTADGGFILCGIDYNTDNSSNDIRVIKTDPNGNTE
jgi:hypothetical protein